jgi:hypothetical protein
VFAQDKWLPGAIVTSSGDTLKGQLSLKAIESNLCRFRSGNEVETDYSASQLNAFWIDGGYSLQSIKLPEGDTPEFALVLVKGRADLLKYRSRFFLLDSLGELFELETVRIRRVVDERLMEITQEKFKQTLMWKFSDCKKATQKISTTVLDQPSLIKLFNVYNSCFEEPAEKQHVSSTRKSSLSFGPDFGFLQTRLGEFSSGWDATMDKSQFSRSQQSFVGGVIRFFPGHYKNISFDLGVHTLKFQFESQKRVASGSIDVYYQNRYHTIRMPLGVTYSFFSWRKLQPFVRLATGFHFNLGNLFGTRVRQSGIQVQTDITNAVHNTGYGLICDIGLNYKTGSFILGVRGTFEQMRSPMVAINKQLPYDFSPTQSNYGAAISLGYVFDLK